MSFIDYAEIVCGVGILAFFIYICLTMGFFKNE